MIKINTDYIAHHGIQGQKWGVRRFQNKDGSLKSAGRKRYSENGKSEPRDKGLAPGTQKSNAKKGLGLAGVTFGLTALGAASYGPTMKALGKDKQKAADPNKMDTADIIERNKRQNAISVYNKNNHLNEPAPKITDMTNAGTQALNAIKQYRNADKPQQGNQVQNRYNTRETLSQSEMDSMSDKDLQKLVNRLNLETQYSRLTQDPPVKDKVEAGLEKATSILAIVGSAVTIGTAAASLHQRFKKR